MGGYKRLREGGAPKSGECKSEAKSALCDYMCVGSHLHARNGHRGTIQWILDSQDQAQRLTPGSVRWNFKTKFPPPVPLGGRGLGVRRNEGLRIGCFIPYPLGLGLGENAFGFISRDGVKSFGIITITCWPQAMSYPWYSPSTTRL